MHSDEPSSLPKACEKQNKKKSPLRPGGEPGVSSSMATPFLPPSVWWCLLRAPVYVHSPPSACNGILSALYAPRFRLSLRLSVIDRRRTIVCANLRGEHGDDVLIAPSPRAVLFPEMNPAESLCVRMTSMYACVAYASDVVYCVHPFSAEGNKARASIDSERRARGAHCGVWTALEGRVFRVGGVW